MYASQEIFKIIIWITVFMKKFYKNYTENTIKIIFIYNIFFMVSIKRSKKKLFSPVTCDGKALWATAKKIYIVMLSILH